MALSPNYGWSEPDNSSLVKNGAADIRTLGDAIDTSLWNVGFGQAGKNKIINGDFGIWQRGTSVSATNTYAYISDRWQSLCDGAITGARTAFTPGTAPVAGYEGKYYLRYTKTSGTYWQIQQYIEDVQTFAGNTVTISFWAKVDSAKTIYVQLSQNFGSGGSGTVTTSAGTQALTTSWARYSFTVAVPSISGKTIGANNNLALEFGIGATTGNITFDIWGVQVEYGSKATPFETATGTLQGELAACQRYYVRFGDSTTNATLSIGTSNSAGTVSIQSLSLPVAMRVAPATLDYANIRLSDGSTGYTISSASIINGTTLRGNISCATSGMTAFRLTMLDASATGNYVGFSAEL
jgi:hypothetical protein